MQDDSTPAERDISSVRRQADHDELRWGSLSDWAELVRLPNIFTVLSNSTAAAILVERRWPPTLLFILLLIASVLAYWGGMILNDVADLEEDRASGRKRPLVTGRISPVLAGHIGSGMLLVGPLLVLFAVFLHRYQPMWMGAAFGTAVALSIAVRIYNSSIKHTPLGPLIMGSCRGLNVLMVATGIFAVVSMNGVSTETVRGDAAQTVETTPVEITSVDPLTIEYPRSVLFTALGLSIYVLGITVFARHEETNSAKPQLILGIALEMIGVATIAAMPWWSEPTGKWMMDISSAYPILVALIGVTVVNRGVMAVTHPVSRKVQLAVKHAILTIVLLDASVVAVSAGPWFGGGIAALLIPAMLIGARFRST
ncbi:MAG: UbiA family prenyltransferase [Pirellulales bacterium]